MKLSSEDTFLRGWGNSSNDMGHVGHDIKDSVTERQVGDRLGEHSSCLWESSAPAGRHTYIFSLTDPETCAPHMSPRQSQANHGIT